MRDIWVVTSLTPENHREIGKEVNFYPGKYQNYVQVYRQGDDQNNIYSIYYVRICSGSFVTS